MDGEKEFDETFGGKAIEDEKRIQHSDLLIAQTNVSDLIHSTMVRFSMQHKIHHKRFHQYSFLNFLNSPNTSHEELLKSWVLVRRLMKPVGANCECAP